LNWKSVATIVKRAVQYGLKHRARPPVHAIGIDEVSVRAGFGLVAEALSRELSSDETSAS
jgi:hypothetical protein